MSRTVKSVYPGYSTPKTSCSFILRIALVVLITQLVDSLALRDQRSDFWLHKRYRRESTGFPRSGDEDNKNNIISSDDHGKTSGFKFRGPDFEVSFNVFHSDEDQDRKLIERTTLSDKEVVRNAIKNGILVKPEKPVRPRISDVTEPEVYTPKIPESCENELICTEDSTYPEDAVAKVVKDSKDLRVLSVVDDLPIGDRISEDGTENLCESVTTMWYAKSVRKNKSKPWHRVVNVQSFLQGFRVGHCRVLDKDCSGGFGKPGRSAICKQQYSYRQIVVLSPENGTAIADLFPIPSGCCCHSQSIDITSFRSLGNTRDPRHRKYPQFR